MAVGRFVMYFYLQAFYYLIFDICSTICNTSIKFLVEENFLSFLSAALISLSVSDDYSAAQAQMREAGINVLVLFSSFHQ